MRFLSRGVFPIGSVAGGWLGGLIGVPWTLVVAACGFLFSVVWLLVSPVRGLRAMPESRGPESARIAG
jgi:hypothetical protein